MVRRPTVLLAFWIAAAARAAVDPFAFHGVVTAVHPDGYCFVRTENGEDWRVEPASGGQGLRPGDMVKVNGELEKRSLRHTRRIFQCAVERTGRDKSRLPAPTAMTIAELSRRPPIGMLPDPDWYARPVTVEGVAIDAFRRECEAVLLLEDRGQVVRVKIAAGLRTPYPDDFAIGARVRATGIALYSAERDGNRVLTGFNNITILAAGMDAIAVLTHPPFFTPARMAIVCLVFALALGGFLAWSLMLRRAVKRALTRLEVTMREKLQERIASDAARRERLRLAHDLHDDFQQLLASVSFRLQAAANIAEGGGLRDLREQLRLATDALIHTQTGLRTVLWSMTEESEGPASLAGLFQYAAGRMAHWEGVVSFVFKGVEKRVSRTFAGTLLMILQEAVGNAIKHGGADHVTVSVEFCADELYIEIVDDGSGFEGIDFGASHLGLRGMRERAAKLGGSLTIDSAIGRGTKVKVRLRYD